MASDFESKILAELQKRFVKAGVYFTSRLRVALNQSQTYTRSKRTGKHHGQDPSKPGQYPHKLSGQLQRSITWRFDKNVMTLTVGSNLAGYPSYLELGTRFMRPRPWLSLGWDAEKGKLTRIVVG